MKRAQRLISRLFVCVAACMMPFFSAARADEFDAERLRAGEDAYGAHRYAEAADLFRVAAFASLDRPPALSECLVRLALAQNGAKRESDVIATIERFLDVEQRFGTYAKANLEPETRRDFQALLLSHTKPATISAIPSLASLIETEDQKIARLPAADRRRALESAARRDPSSARWPALLAVEALERGDAKAAEKWADKALSIDPKAADALQARARARYARGDFAASLQDISALPPGSVTPELAGDRFVALVETRDWTSADAAVAALPAAVADRPDVARSRQKLASARPGSRPAAPAGPAPAAAPASAAPAPAAPAPSAADLAARSREAILQSKRLVAAGKAVEANRLLLDAVAADPKNRELRLALLESATLSRAYPLAAAQLPVVTPFQKDDSASMFYAAIVLYETGKADEAKAYLERAMPNVKGQLVDEYAPKILGRTP
jgi:tetratricopeptide (TPR) repeat protein